jgi:predicted nucleic acid-binding protein
MHRKSDALTDDARIAATAVVHGLVVVTRNVRDFQPFKVQTFNPFTASS